MRLLLDWLIEVVLLKLVIVLNNYDVLVIEPFVNFVKGFANRWFFWCSPSVILRFLTAIKLNMDLTPRYSSRVPIDLIILVYTLKLRPYLLVKLEPLIFFC